eukprot:TRINITY_DN24429_c0_g1_i1.p2 TRINITY_DN24429_c0_g1~~TRINITY_DN24429_c0_g1_i1.p2  ORF type:complete len:138 (-),score=24.48 TRINITY_DN24429_c0_g1_i1:613-1026(-)
MLHGQSLAKRIAALLCLCYVGIIGGGAAAAPKLYDGDGIIRFLTGELGRLLVIVPGHGKPERTATLLGSIRWLMEEEWSLGEGPECLVFVYNTSASKMHRCDRASLGQPFLAFRPHGSCCTSLAWKLWCVQECLWSS